MSQNQRPLLAVLIDADNIPAKHAAAILKEITTFGEPALRRVYGDWSNASLKNWTEAVQNLGLVAHQESANTKGKNASDIGLVIDAMDILHSGRFDGFVLVSSDSDFTALANRIREQGLTVFGIGEDKTPASLRNVCNRFIRIENIGDQKQQPQKSKAQGAVPLIHAAMNKIDQDGDWFSLSTIGQKIAAAHSDFDVRSYGFQKLSELVRSLPEFKTQKSQNNGKKIEVCRVEQKR